MVFRVLYVHEMPRLATEFNISWLERIDSDSVPVKGWLKKGTKPSSFICTLCKTGDLCCGNKGWQSLERHMDSKKHRDNIKLLKENNTFTIQAEVNRNPLEADSSSSNMSTVTIITS